MEQPLKIAYLSVFYPFRGGIAQFNTELYKSLEKVSEVKAFNFSTQYPNLLFPGKTQYVSEVDENPGIESERLLSSVNPLSFQKTIKEIEAYNPDVLLTTFWMPFFGPSLGYVSKRLKKKCVNISILHNAIPHEPRVGDKALTQYYLKQQDGFGVLSDTVKKGLLSLLPEAKFFQKPHPLYGQFGPKKDKVISKAKFKIQPDQKVLLFFGFIRKYKGLDLLIKAMKDITEESVLLITGESYGDFKEYEELLIQEGIKEELLKKHIRYIPDEEVADIFSASDICILPYRSATQSGIASIAKYYQLPMVVTPVGELPNEVEDGITGVVCASSEPLDIAKGVNKALTSLELFQSKLADEVAENTWENFAIDLISFTKTLPRCL